MTREEQIIKAANEHYLGQHFNEIKISHFVNGAKWADKTMIKRAYEWIKENFENYVGVDVSEYYIYDDEFADDFRKAMEE